MAVGKLKRKLCLHLQLGKNLISLTHRQSTKFNSDEESAHEKEGSEIEQGLSPPDTDDGKHIKTFNTSNKHEKTISGRVTKPRISPRKGSKKDYKKLGDPFVELKGTTNTDGEQVFDTEKSDSEDSFESDGDYMKGAKAATIKMEEEI